ncbi:MAG: pyridoxamine 5'-phosphate oxidase family protein [Gammaproteobacteria bacterium]|nr:pyridoxamine 5'-phosphate oxidase family protein [Gammaproteobacteria bacterium]MDH5693748.1 pyridoxamine 5'-phosphate oxidase family protein [Gammaproteobacteria bacterium]
MGDFHKQLDEKLIEFIQRQHLFFTGTAPQEGRINVSPKGMDTFRVLSSNQCVFLNLTGSGNETAAHVLENNRITIMFCSFEKQPLILRLYGSAEIIGPDHSAWQDTLASFPDYPGARQCFLINIDSVQTSCGFGVPLFHEAEERPTLAKWAENKGEKEIRKYWKEKNSRSIDGLSTDK